MKSSHQNTLEQFENYELKVKTYSQAELLSTISDLFIKEKKISDAILILLAEIQNRRIYAELGFSSLFELLVKYFKLSESSTYSRISLIKLIREVPEAKAALVSGAASMSNLVLANTFINEQKKTDNKLGPQEKKAIVELVKDKSFRDAKEQLALLHPAIKIPADKSKTLNDSKISLNFTIDKELQKKLDHIKNLISHQNPNPNMNELLTIMADISIAHIEKKKGINPKVQTSVKNASKTGATKQVLENTPKGIAQVPSTQQGVLIKKQSRYISREVKRAVYNRAQGQCEYISKEGLRCNCKKFLELEHIKPYSCGGSNDEANLLFYCQSHNAFSAKIFFGKDPREYLSKNNIN